MTSRQCQVSSARNTYGVEVIPVRDWVFERVQIGAASATGVIGAWTGAHHVVGLQVNYNGNTIFDRACFLGDPSGKMQIAPGGKSRMPDSTYLAWKVPMAASQLLSAN